MRKKLLLVAVLAANLYYAQDGRVGINTTDPKTTLDVRGKSDASGNPLPTDATGLQAPRLTRKQLTDKTVLYGADQTGALIYITDENGGDNSGQREFITSKGYYYFDGTANKWIKVGSGSGSSAAAVTADNGLTMSTASNVQLGGTLLKNTEIALGGFNTSFTGQGKVGIGINTPKTELHVSQSSVTTGITSPGLKGAITMTGTANTSADGPGLYFEAVNALSNQRLMGVSYNINAAGDSRLSFARLSNNGSTAIGSDFGQIMTIHSLGNVGIGPVSVASPTEKLDVGGNVRFRGVPKAGVIGVDGATVTSASTDKMMVLASDGTGKLYPLPATVKKVSPEQTGNFTFTASDDWDVILFNKAAGANAVLTLPVTGVAPGKTVYVSNVGQGAIDVPSSIMRAAPPSPNIGGGHSVTFVFLGPEGNNKWAQVSGF